MSDNPIFADLKKRGVWIIVGTFTVITGILIFIWISTHNKVFISLTSVTISLAITILLVNGFGYRVNDSTFATKLGTLSGPIAVFAVFVVGAFFATNNIHDSFSDDLETKYDFDKPIDEWVAVGKDGEIISVGIKGTKKASSINNTFEWIKDSVAFQSTSNELIFFNNGVVIGKYTLPELVSLIGQDAVIDLSYINEHYGAFPYVHSPSKVLVGKTDELDYGNQSYNERFNTGIPFKIKFLGVKVEGTVTYSLLSIENRTNGVTTPAKVRDYGGFFHLVGSRLFFIKILEAYHKADDFNEEQIKQFKILNPETTQSDIDYAIDSGNIEQLQNYIKVGIVEILRKSATN